MKKKSYIASAIRHLAPSLLGDVVAVALFEHSVSLWDLSTGTRVSEFGTILDFGGKRLALSQQQSACLTAAYHIHGLACYGTPAGELRWKRKDLKKVQQIVVTPDGQRAYCCIDEGPCQVIAISTGATVECIRGLRRVWIDSHDALRLHESSKLAVVNRNGAEAFRITPGSFAVLDAAFSRAHLAVSESTADVRLFDLSSGREVVRYTQPRNHHVLVLSATPGAPLFHGVQWNYARGGPKRLIRFRPDSSESEIVSELGQPAETVFFHGGCHLLTSEGDIIDCQSGKTVRKLSFPQKEYPRD